MGRREIKRAKGDSRWVNPLPHFSIAFMLGLRKRFVQRLYDQMSHDFGHPEVFERYWYGGMIDVGHIADQMVMRTYRTQLREMKAVSDFSEAMIAYYNQRNPDQRLELPGQGDRSKADAMVNKLKRAATAQL